MYLWIWHIKFVQAVDTIYGVNILFSTCFMTIFQGECKWECCIDMDLKIVQPGFSVIFCNVEFAPQSWTELITFQETGHFQNYFDAGHDLSVSCTTCVHASQFTSGYCMWIFL